jgi:hypothetical protein
MLWRNSHYAQRGGLSANKNDNVGLKTERAAEPARFPVAEYGAVRPMVDRLLPQPERATHGKGKTLTHASNRIACEPALT